MALPNHDHSGSKNDHGGTFDAANLTSATATDGHVLMADGAGGAAWEVLPDIEAGDIDSGAATSGKVLTADGAGAADWEDPAIVAANIGSGAATSGQVLTADGGGDCAWQSPSAWYGIPVAVTANWATPANAWADIKTATGVEGRVGVDAAVATIIFHIWEG